MSKVIRIKRFDKSLPLPEHKTKGAAGFDFTAREDTAIKAGEIAIIPLNVALEVPKGYVVLLVERSSTRKFGVTMINGVGIMDSDFRGDEDEYRFLAQNFTKKTVVIEKGTRIAQGILIKHETVKFKEVSKLGNKTRGGFGTTGHK
jgi:dUTP pyrophosphatase